MKDKSPFALKRHCIATALILGMAPMASHAFIDERTAKQEPAPVAQVSNQKVVAPAVVPAATGAIQISETQIPAATMQPVAQAQTAPATQAVVTQTAPASAAPVAVPFQAGVMGDITTPVWKGTYPGPYGKMPLADALIAQVVPVVGGAISLAGSPMLLDRDVTLPKGLNRLNTLTHMAKANNLGIFIQGKNVSLAGPDTTPAPGTQVKPAAVVPVGPETKAWSIETGTMLSSAVLDWAQKWGWTLIWKADVDYRIVAPIRMEKTFLDGVSEVLDAYRGGDRPLWGDWQSEQKILVIREPSSRER